MTDSFPLLEAQEVIGRQWSQSPDPGRRQLLELARDALLFILDTGQRYPLEDFRESLKAGAPASVDGTAATLGPEEHPSLQKRLSSTQEFFAKLLDEPESAGERGLIQSILDILRFISATGQFSNFGEYLKHVAAGGPPYAVACFDTREEAEAWLRHHPHPPDSANVLIANAYHAVVYDRATGTRRLLPNRDLEYHLDELRRKEPPVAGVSFRSLEDANAWLQSQPSPASWAWVSIADEPYLAAYYPNISHRVLYPLSLANGYEVEPG